MVGGYVPADDQFGRECKRVLEDAGYRVFGDYIDASQRPACVLVAERRGTKPERGLHVNVFHLDENLWKVFVWHFRQGGATEKLSKQFHTADELRVALDDAWNKP